MSYFYYEDYNDRMDKMDKIESHNEKSKNIIKEYERLISLKNNLTKNKIKELFAELKSLGACDCYEDYQYERYLEKHFDDEELAVIKKIANKIFSLERNPPYPHGNGLFGFALVLQEASENIKEEWKYPIWMHTICDYKLVYPKHATDYIQYEKDINSPMSKELMNKIYEKLRKEGKNIYEMFYVNWVEEIKKYLTENSITISEETVFRPHLHSYLRESRDTDDLHYERVTKSCIDEHGQEDDYDDYPLILNSDCEEDDSNALFYEDDDEVNPLFFE